MPAGVADHGPLGRAEELVVVEVAAVRVERGALGERDRVQPAARVGELHAVARTEEAAALRGPGGRLVGVHGARV